MTDVPIGREKWLIYDRRAVISYDVGVLCKFDCVYCYNNEEMSIPQTRDLEKTIAQLADFTDLFEIVTPGCEQELFLNPSMAIDFLQSVESMGKIISFATKVPLSAEIIRKISAINKRLQQTGNYIVGEVSFVSGTDNQFIEGSVPSVAMRISTLRRLHEQGIFSVPFIRPVLPPELVPEQDLITLIEQTKEFCQVYATGDFYFNQRIKERMGLDRLGKDFWNCVTEDAEANFLNTEKETTWYKYINTERKARIRTHIEAHGRSCYDSSTEAILHFRQTRDL